MAPLEHLERPADGDPAGLLVLHHGRGTDAPDLFELADLLDPERRLHVAAPRAPLSLPGSPGFHWYVVPQFGYPDPETFHAARGALAELHDRLWAQTGIDPSATVLGGFSMGTMMSYAMAFDEDRPPVAGLLGFSGFLPVVDDWKPRMSDRTETRLFMAHGENDPILEVAGARRTRDLAKSAGLDVTYRESPVGHQLDPAHIPPATAWLAGVGSEHPPEPGGRQ